MHLESIEPRQLLSVTLNGSVLEIVGSNAVDSAVFSEEITAKGKRVYQVQFNGETFQYGRSAVSQFLLDLKDGADLVILGTIPVPAKIFGGQGPDTLSGGDGEDSIYGEGGGDVITGRDGNDLLDGGLQGDLIRGLSGDDTIYAGSTITLDDTVFGGDGRDTVRYAKETNGLLLRIGANISDITVDDDIRGDVELLYGTQFADRIVNESGKSMKLFGLAGNDTILSGKGSDTLDGGAGADSLSGGAANDIFVAQDSEIDSVDGGDGTDSIFSSDAGDVITTVP